MRHLTGQQKPKSAPKMKKESISTNEYKVRVIWGSDKFCGDILKKAGFDVGDDDFLSRGSCYVSTDGMEHPVIWLSRPPRTSEYIGCLAHEAFHAVWEIADYIDCKNDEFIAHSIAAVVRETLKKYRK